MTAKEIEEHGKSLEDSGIAVKDRADTPIVKNAAQDVGNSPECKNDEQDIQNKKFKSNVFIPKSPLDELLVSNSSNGNIFNKGGIEKKDTSCAFLKKASPSEACEDSQRQARKHMGNSSQQNIEQMRFSASITYLDSDEWLDFGMGTMYIKEGRAIFVRERIPTVLLNFVLRPNIFRHSDDNILQFTVNGKEYRAAIPDVLKFKKEVKNQLLKHKLDTDKESEIGMKEKIIVETDSSSSEENPKEAPDNNGNKINNSVNSQDEPRVVEPAGISLPETYSTTTSQTIVDSKLECSSETNTLTPSSISVNVSGDGDSDSSKSDNSIFGTRT